MRNGKCGMRNGRGNGEWEMSGRRTAEVPGPGSRILERGSPQANGQPDA